MTFVDRDTISTSFLFDLFWKVQGALFILLSFFLLFFSALIFLLSAISHVDNFLNTEWIAENILQLMLHINSFVIEKSYINIFKWKCRDRFLVSKLKMYGILAQWAQYNKFVESRSKN